MRLKWATDTFAKFVYPLQVRISPEGDLLAYTLRRIDMKTNTYIDRIVIAQAKGEKRYELEQGSFNPMFSPDGKNLLYLVGKSHDAKRQIHILDVETRDSRRIACYNNIQELDWNADGMRILVRSFHSREDPDLYFEREAPVWIDGSGFKDSRHSSIRIINVLTQSELEYVKAKDIVRVLWHGKSIVYAQKDQDTHEQRYNIFEVINDRAQMLLEGVYMLPSCSVDGQLYLTGRPKKESHFQHNYHYVWNGNKLQSLTEIYDYDNTRGIGADIWAGQDSMVSPKVDSYGAVYFKTSMEGKTSIDKLEKRRKTTLICKKGVITSFDVSHNGSIAYIGLTDRQLPEVSVIHSGLKVFKTSYNDQIGALLQLRPMTNLSCRSFDGMKIEGWWVRPDRPQGAPLIVFAHGGPKSAYGYSIYYLSQILAEEGFYVLHMNPRGSSSYNEQFALAVAGDPGGADLQDILAGIKALCAIESVDEERMGIAGISYGGYLVNCAVTQTNLFRAAVSENGVCNRFTGYACSDIGLWYEKHLTGSSPLQADARSYREKSPVFFAERVQTPILFIHSLEDYRCPLAESIQFHHVLRDLGKESYIAVFKHGSHNHGTRGTPRHRLKRYQLIVDFFLGKLLKGDTYFNSVPFFGEEANVWKCPADC